MSAILVAAALQLTPDAPEPIDAKDPKWNASVWARARGTTHGNWSLDETGTKDDPRSFVETRVRAMASVQPLEWLALSTEIDAWSGVAAGAASDVGTLGGRVEPRYRFDRRIHAGDVELRQLFVAVRTPIGELRAGRMAFKWGTGFLANDGRGEPDFGDTRYGDLIDRIVFGTRVSDLTLFLGGDHVFRDENADYRRGDDAFGAIFGARWERDALTVGAFYAYRTQKDRLEPEESTRRATVKAHAVDAYARVGLTKQLAFEGEVATVHGTTTRPLFEESIDGADIATLGGVLRLRLDLEKFSLKNEVGYASGDGDPYDGTAKTFTFDPDYKVGLLLFDPLLGRISGRAIDRIGDPALVRQPQAGSRFLASNGAVSNAVYVNLVGKFRPTRDLELRGGWLYAQSAVPFVDPYTSAQNGGYATAFDGRRAVDRALGHEFDAAVRWTALRKPLLVRVGAEGGVLAKGRAFRGLSLGTPWLARLGLDLVW